MSTGAGAARPSCAEVVSPGNIFDFDTDYCTALNTALNSGALNDPTTVRGARDLGTARRAGA